ncbi:MAG: flagellar biosynthetic protein FliO, partial [Clostridiales bacterium]|nr:flagellar biosynthetic protein FliO [Clostridiales bacterium]
MFLNAGISSSNGWTMFTAIAQLFFILVVFVVILFLSYYVTKWVGSGKYAKKNGNNLKILDSLGLGVQSGIHLVQAGKKYV